MQEIESKQDKYWQELASISLTPNAKIGMGKLFTFEFLAPCFDSEAPRNRRKTPDIDGMTFYGEVKFNFSQFGADENLRRTSPLQYCVKMCHIIGFYL